MKENRKKIEKSVLCSILKNKRSKKWRNGSNPIKGLSRLRKGKEGEGVRGFHASTSILEESELPRKKLSIDKLGGNVQYSWKRSLLNFVPCGGGGEKRNFLQGYERARDVQKKTRGRAKKRKLRGKRYESSGRD